MFDSDVRLRRARGTLCGRMLFAVLAMLATCVNSFAAPLPPATNGVIAFSGLGFVNPDGTGLTYGLSYGYDPAWSPDGNKIAFAIDFIDGNTWCGCIMVANADGSGLTPLSTPLEAWQEDRWPSWSPDGSKILFSRLSGGFSSQLYVMNSDGSNPVELPLSGIRASWSPDGARIIYGSGGIVTANPDGTNATWVHEGFHPAWSRDGTRIAFSGYNFDSENPNAVIFTANPDFSNVTQLTFGCLPSGCDDREVAWSPDGTKLVFFRFANDTPDGVFVMNADGSGLTQLVADDWAEYPAWRPIPTASPPFPFTGFFSPLGPAGTRNVAKAGSSVPIKFSLGGNRGLNILVAGSPSTQAVSCSGGGPVSGAVATNAAGKTELKYDAKSMQYTYVMKTEKAWKNTCRTLTVALTDGTSHTADFRFN